MIFQHLPNSAILHKSASVLFSNNRYFSPIKKNSRIFSLLLTGSFPSIKRSIPVPAVMQNFCIFWRILHIPSKSYLLSSFLQLSFLLKICKRAKKLLQNMQKRVFVQDDILVRPLCVYFPTTCVLIRGDVGNSISASGWTERVAKKYRNKLQRSYFCTLQYLAEAAEILQFCGHVINLVVFMVFICVSEYRLRDKCILCILQSCLDWHTHHRSRREKKTHLVRNRSRKISNEK